MVLFSHCLWSSIFLTVLRSNNTLLSVKTLMAPAVRQSAYKHVKFEEHEGVISSV